MRRVPSMGVRFVGLLACSVFVFAGCDNSDPSGPGSEPETFVGLFEPAAAYDDLVGSAAISVGDEAFSVSVAIQGAPAAGSGGHPWALFEGTCAQTGGLLMGPDDLPLITLSTDGEWGASSIEGDLTEAQSMALELRLSMDQPNTVVACATLQPEGG